MRCKNMLKLVPSNPTCAPMPCTANKRSILASPLMPRMLAVALSYLRVSSMSAEAEAGALLYQVGRPHQVCIPHAVRFHQLGDELAAEFLRRVQHHVRVGGCFQGAASNHIGLQALFFKHAPQVHEVDRGAGQHIAQFDALAFDGLKLLGNFAALLLCCTRAGRFLPAWLHSRQLNAGMP